MKISRGQLSRSEAHVLFAICIITVLLMTFGPMVYASITGKPISSGNIVPKHGTVEYMEYMERFETEHGRELTVADEMIAIKNGAYMLACPITTLLAICMVFAMVHDLRCWKYERAAYRDGLTIEPPMATKQQMCRVLFYLVFAIPFGCYMWFVMPSMLTPIT